MAQCLQCSNELTGDFGLVECSECKAVLFIDMDGQVSVSEDENESSVVNLDNNLVEQEAAFDEEESVDSSFLEPEMAAEFEEEVTYEEPIEEVYVSAEDEAATEETSFLEETLEEFVDEPSVIAPAAIVEDENMDLSEFANQLSPEVGFLAYNLTFSGIDTAKIREDFRSALQDPKFNWDAEDILEGVSEGVLKIERVSSIKAVVLINKVKAMSVRCSWEQINVHQN